VYPFIEAEKVERRNVAKACDLLEVSRSAFYAWQHHQPSRRQLDDETLSERVAEIHSDTRGVYGWPRVYAQLRREGFHVSRKRVARIMRQLGLIGRCKRRFTRTTFPDPEAAAVDLLKRAFGPGSVEIDPVYVSDITYIWTWEGWLYLATVIRRVVGWAMADHMRASLACDALQMAITARRPAPGLVFHSDRGTQPGQYTSVEFAALLEAHQVTQSLSRPRQCWDNAVAESWFASLKEECLHRQSWPTRAQARRAVFDYIEVFYNRQRLHSSLGYLTPVEYEQIHHPNPTQAA
jgi:transposase InsO family protein